MIFLRGLPLILSPNGIGELIIEDLLDVLFAHIMSSAHSENCQNNDSCPEGPVVLLGEAIRDEQDEEYSQTSYC